MKNLFHVRRRPNFYFSYDDIIVVLNISNLDEDSTVSIYDDDVVEVGGKSFDFEKKPGEDIVSLFKNINEKNSKVNILIYYPSNVAFSDIFKKFSFLEKYKIDEKKKNHVYILMKTQYGEYDFEPLNIKVPDINLQLNYGEKFKEDIYKKIVYKLNTTHKGLYMLHGLPGTGKSSLIKHLTTVVDKEFIFVPATFIEKFIADPDIFSILIRRKKYVLILEDAEKILISRESDDNQFISTLLNMSDGILSDILEASIILTFNCEHTKIDKALRRKGRTIIDYKFKNLSVDEAKKLAEHLNFTEEQMKKIDKEMSLSEIYNINEENKFYKDEEENNKVIGFGVK
jgi:hypothetical protein